MGKTALWESLVPLVNNNSDDCLCVCGDFNSVRSNDEKKGRRSIFRQVEADHFNRFIEDCSLIDLPICGRLFTWYRGDGVSMSRLDHFLLSHRWCEVGPNCIQVACQWGLSYHVPLLLYVDEANWGPRPLYMLKCWADFTGYEDFVREQWASFNDTGWGGFVLREKLKMMKFRLKEWHYQHSQNLNGKMVEIKNRMVVLDEKGETESLLEEETEELHNISFQLRSSARVQNNINWQKSRMKWLQEGDANTHKIHGIMSNRRRQNTINLVSVNGEIVEGVQNIRAAVFNHFSSHFKRQKEG